MSTQQSDFDGTHSLPTITPATYEAVRKMMADDGIQPRDNDQISEYVQKLIARESFFRTVDTIQDRNKHVNPAEIEAAIDDADAKVRTARRKQDPGADRS